MLKNQEHLTPKQAEVLRAIYRQYPTLAHFHWAKEQLRAFYRAPSLGHAQALLERLLLSLQHADDAELVRWGRTLHARKAELLSYHRHRATSAYTEGIQRTGHEGRVGWGLITEKRLTDQERSAPPHPLTLPFNAW